MTNQQGKKKLKSALIYSPFGSNIKRETIYLTSISAASQSNIILPQTTCEYDGQIYL
jgi:hypothetical protein